MSEFKDLEKIKKEVRKELPKAEEWVIKYAANVRLRSWIEQNFTEKDLNMAFKNYMNVGNNYAAFTEDEVMFNNNTQSPIILNVKMPEEVGYHPDIQKMVEADTAAFYEAVKLTIVGIAHRVKKAVIAGCFSDEQVTATI